MKTTFLSIALLFALISQSLNAQISIAPIAGTNISGTIVSPYPLKTSYTNYYFLGTIVKYELSDKLSVQTGLQYSEKGYKNYQGNFEEPLPKIKYTYFDILPVVEYKPYKFIGIFGGFNFGIFLSEKYKYEGSVWENKLNTKTVNDLDLGGLLGVKFYYRNFFLSAHYNQSLSTISTQNTTDNYGNVIGTLNQRNSTFQVGAGYFFNL